MSAVNPVVALALLILLVVAVVSLVLALRNRLAFRIAVRNVRRGGRRTLLLLLGLMVATTIISGSLIVGDTDNQLNLHYTYLADGFTDEALYHSVPGSSSNAYFPISLYTALAASVRGNSQIAGLSPEILGTIQVYDRTTGIPQTGLNLIGANGNQSGALGRFVTDSGASLAGPDPGRVLLDSQAASEIDARAGDSITLYGPSIVPTTVQAVVQDNVRGAFLTAGIGTGGNVFVDLATAQRLYNASDAINYIAVTNAGSQATGASASDAVSASLNASLANIPGGSLLTVHELLKDDLAVASNAGSSLTTLFLVLGLFSIVAGAMLIVGLFVMLAEERKGEMGLVRAVGMRRGGLVRVFFFEGLVYSAGAALAGTLLGILAGYLLVYAFSLLLPSAGLSQAAILASFTVTQQSLVISYVVGFLLTLVTVTLASRRASRLNIVRAIRDIPEPRPPRHWYTLLAGAGAVALVFGLLLFFVTYRGSSDISYPLIGGAVAILGVALVAARFVPNRAVFSAAGAAFLVWAGLEPLHTALLGSQRTGGIFVVFVEGVTMVMGALLLYVFNSTTLVAALGRAIGGRRTKSPVVQVALAYPSRQATRTTINLSIFALVVFTLVAIAAFGSTLDANLSNTVQTEGGGYTFFGFSPLPIPDLPGQIAANTTLAPLFAAAVPLVSGPASVAVPGSTPSPYGDSVYAASAAASPTSSFYATNRFPFDATWHGLSGAAVMAQLRTNASVAVVDDNYAPPTTNLASGGPTGPPHPSLNPGATIRITDPLTGRTASVVVLGILKESIINGVWLNPARASSLGYATVSSYFLTIQPGVSALHAAQQAKIAFFRWGLVLFDLGALLSAPISTTEGFVGLLQIFVGLGLVVGIAAMGIVAMRAVVERRREIGMLRASGFTQGMILRLFLIEYSFVTLLGIGIGTALGLLIVYNLSLSPSAAASGVTMFTVPVTNLVIILGAAYGLALAAVAGPSLRAARLPPAEATRSIE